MTPPTLAGRPHARSSTEAAAPAPAEASARAAPRDALVRAPVTTYRLQLSHAFTLRQFGAVADYLHTLGVTDCYCSPLLTASPGSTHGYDICNHGELNPELGTLEDLRALAATLRAYDMGLIVDFVPNHMGIDPGLNVWWRDVLENGPSSLYARYFDIDWTPIKPELRDKVLLPILGDQYGLVLERGELQLAFADGTLVLHYGSRRLPINPRQAPMVVGHRIDELSAALGHAHADVEDLRRILSALSSLPAISERDEATIAGRDGRKEAAQADLAALAARSPAVAAHIERAVADFNGQPGVPESFDRLHAFLEVQAYRLAYWRTAFDEINYRRFFDVNELAGLRMEDTRVFADTHALVLDLIGEGLVTGLRIDHPDGLFDPAAYFEDLQKAAAARLARPGHRLYVAAEKVLGRGERLRDDWAIHGTTGYGFLNTLNGLFVPADGLADLRRTYRRFTGHRELPSDTMYASKRFVMRGAMASELTVLSLMLNRLSEGHRQWRDFTLNSLRRALLEVTACFPVYRTYVTARGASKEDVAVVNAAIAEARRRNPVQEPSIFEFTRRALLPQLFASGSAADPNRDRSVAFAHKFQQYTAPVVAKGQEDTAFYRDVLLLSANEVGGDLRHRTRTVSEFHADNLHRRSRWPYELTAGSTHDTKRGEDARARINVIAERPEQWRAALAQWAAINDGARTRIGGLSAPDRNDEWLFYQSLVGAWPAEPLDAPLPTAAPDAFIARVQTFMGKAIKEAKLHTSWLHANLEYEEGVARFVQTVLGGERAAPFLASFVPFRRRLAWFGMVGSLAQLVLRLGAPGVPDVYQGSELWNFSLVDPDNRQPVDFDERAALLRELGPLLDAADEARTCGGPLPQLKEGLRVLFDEWPDGRVKMFTLAVALRLRRAHPDLFLRGEYEPLGSDLDDPHLVAFTRRFRDQELVVAVPRFVATMLRGTPRPPVGLEEWRTASVRLPSRLAHTTLVNIFTGERVEPVVYRDVPWLMAGSAFQSWPVAMLWAT